MEPILHLSIPVADLAASTAFYVDVLGCSAGRASDLAADVWFLGMQLTLQHRPAEVLEEPGARHFGATLDRAALDALCERVEAHAWPWLRDPATNHGGTEREERKAYLADPSGNVIELKAYTDLTATLHATQTGYA